MSDSVLAVNTCYGILYVVLTGDLQGQAYYERAIKVNNILYRFNTAWYADSEKIIVSLGSFGFYRVDSEDSTTYAGLPTDKAYSAVRSAVTEALEHLVSVTPDIRQAGRRADLARVADDLDAKLDSTKRRIKDLQEEYESLNNLRLDALSAIQLASLMSDDEYKHTLQREQFDARAAVTRWSEGKTYVDIMREIREHHQFMREYFSVEGSKEVYWKQYAYYAAKGAALNDLRFSK